MELHVGVNITFEYIDDILYYQLFFDDLSPQGYAKIFLNHKIKKNPRNPNSKYSISRNKNFEYGKYSKENP